MSIISNSNKIVSLMKMIPAGSCHGLIWFLSSQAMLINVGAFDKTAHISEYTVLGILLSFGLSLQKDNLELKGKYCLYFGLLIGAMDELHQHFTPGRTMDIFDFCADTTGISLGILIWLIVLKLFNSYKSKKFDAILQKD